MKKWNWNDAITWKDYGIWCLIVLVCYLPVLIWYLWQYRKMLSNDTWFKSEPVVIPINYKKCDEKEES